MIETEIKKGSAPVKFMGLDISKEAYHLVESQAKMNQLLDYFFRNGEFSAMADKKIRNNMYMDASGRKSTFRSVISEKDRKNMEESAKRWIKKKQPSFDGDVYVEDSCCNLELLENKGKCIVKGAGNYSSNFQQKTSDGIISAVPDVPERDYGASGI